MERRFLRATRESVERKKEKERKAGESTATTSGEARRMIFETKRRLDTARQLDLL